MRANTVAIIGAGPVGLAAGAHALERGLAVVILEQGHEAGHSIRQWQHVKMFSPSEFNVDHACERLLKRVGWKAPAPDVLPTGRELVEHYIAPLASETPLKDHLKSESKVPAISRFGFDKLRTAGMKSYGLAPTFLMITGYEQVRSILADIVGGKEGAAKVALVLPETGVCSEPLDRHASDACCEAPPAHVDGNGCDVAPPDANKGCCA